MGGAAEQRMSMEKETDLLLEVHERLLRHYDIDRWHWRAETPPLDVCLGAILVQHTAWSNVEKAMANLRASDTLSLETLAALPEDELAALVRAAGTPLTKARRIQVFVNLVLNYGGFDGLFALPDDELRRILLATHGIGPETADVILLYAARRPAIVNDAYTIRLLRRLGTGPEGERYDVWRSWLNARLPDDVAFRWANHAAIVVHCKATCRARPLCTECTLTDICAVGRQAF
jgi:endonuclease III related protein